MSLLAELYEEMDRNPPGIEARKLLVEQFISADMVDAVKGQVEELYPLCRSDEQVNIWFQLYCEDTMASDLTVKRSSTIDTRRRQRPQRPQQSSSRQPVIRSTRATAVDMPDLSRLAERYRAFKRQAQTVLRDMRMLQNLQPAKSSKARDNGELAVLQALADGKITSALAGKPNSNELSQFSKPVDRSPDSARSIASKIQVDPSNAAMIAIQDLEEMIPWLRSNGQNAKSLDDNTLREVLAKRVRLISSALPEHLQTHPQNALMHIEHEQLNRKYVNDETMYGDSVADILRDNFYATEDGYAWDMEELAQAIRSQEGVMRNPLSRHMFTPADIKAIVQHPQGRGLAALQVEQGRLRQGVRPKTLEEMDRIAKILLEDMAEDALKSRHAIDEFLAYVATLPELEQKAIDNLRVPAKDSHTGQAFDGSIGEAVRDAKANKLCFHKAGMSSHHGSVHLLTKTCRRLYQTSCWLPEAKLMDVPLEINRLE